jgi:hypothetical protein
MFLKHPASQEAGGVVRTRSLITVDGRRLSIAGAALRVRWRFSARMDMMGPGRLRQVSYGQAEAREVPWHLPLLRTAAQQYGRARAHCKYDHVDGDGA